MHRARAFILTAMAACGLLGAHVLDYILVVPDPTHRHDLLLRSGHGYLSRAIAITVVAGLVAVLASAMLGLRNGKHSKATVGDWAVLAGMQTGAFVALESLERVLSNLTADRRFLLVLVVGAVLQLATAGVSLLLMRLFERAGAALGALGARVAPPATEALVRSDPSTRRTVGRILHEACAPRAPPLVLSHR